MGLQSGAQLVSYGSECPLSGMSFQREVLADSALASLTQGHTDAPCSLKSVDCAQTKNKGTGGQQAECQKAEAHLRPFLACRCLCFTSPGSQLHRWTCHEIALAVVLHALPGHHIMHEHMWNHCQAAEPKQKLPSQQHCETTGGNLLQRKDWTVADCPHSMAVTLEAGTKTILFSTDFHLSYCFIASKQPAGT